MSNPQLKRLVAIMRASIGGGNTYATGDPLFMGGGFSLSGGNLTATSAITSGMARSTISKSSGKWSWRITENSVNSSTQIGVCNSSTTTSQQLSNAGLSSIAYTRSGYIIRNNTMLATVIPWNQNDVISIDYDADSSTVYFYRNGTLIYTATGGNVPTGALYAAISNNNDVLNVTANFGAIPFTPTSGYNAGLYT